MRVAFEDFLLDTERRELTRSSCAVHLTPLAFDLLEILIESRPKAILRQELFDRLWPDVFVDTSSLHKLIHELRSAMEDGDRRIIRTVYGRGFAFGIPAVRLDGVPLSSFELIVGERRIPLHEGENRIGRERGIGICIEAPGISRLHARIVVDGERARIEDLGSKNGTFVGGRRIRTLTPVAAGAEILLGSVSATLAIVAPAKSTETADEVRTW